MRDNWGRLEEGGGERRRALEGGAEMVEKNRSARLMGHSHHCNSIPLVTLKGQAFSEKSSIWVTQIEPFEKHMPPFSIGSVTFIFVFPSVKRKG